MPIHRLDEQPTVSAILADLTCGQSPAASYPCPAHAILDLNVHAARNESWALNSELGGGRTSPQSGEELSSLVDCKCTIVQKA